MKREQPAVTNSDDGLLTVTGVVRMRDGSPVAGATVRSITGSDETATVARTDDAGRFQLQAVFGKRLSPACEFGRRELSGSTEGAVGRHPHRVCVPSGADALAGAPPRSHRSVGRAPGGRERRSPPWEPISRFKVSRVKTAKCGSGFPRRSGSASWSPGTRRWVRAASETWRIALVRGRPSYHSFHLRHTRFVWSTWMAMGLAG